MEQLTDRGKFDRWGRSNQRQDQVLAMTRHIAESCGPDVPTLSGVEIEDRAQSSIALLTVGGRHCMRILSAILGAVLLMFVLSTRGSAQTGSIQGTVIDQTGAAVVTADVTVRNIDTDLALTIESSSTGSYDLTNLPVGRYGITVKKDGFSLSRVDDVVLTVDQVITANVQLHTGSVSEVVEVKGDELPAIDLNTAAVSNLVDARQMQDLPLIVRDPYSLVLLSPGTSQTNTFLSGFTVNGSRERNNNFLLDGVDNNDTSVPGIPSGILAANPDSTREFRVITNNFSAEFGRNTGAIIDVVTNSGTNQFHGSAYEFGRWNSFGGARDWFNRRLDSSGNIKPMDPYVRNQFGYSVGGPIRKNKTFFFFNEELDRFRTTLRNTVVAPTAAFKTGQFNYTNPQTGVTSAVDLTQGGANNLNNLPLDPTVQKILALYPTPSQSADGMSGVVSFPSASKQNSYATVARIDHQISAGHSLSLRYSYDHSFDPNPFHSDILPGNVGGVSEKFITQGLSARLTSRFTSTAINSFSFGWNRNYSNFACTGLSVLDSVSPLDAFGNGRDYNMDPFSSFGCTALISDSQWRKTGTTSYGDNVTWTKGAHTLRFGSEFRNVSEQGSNGFLSRRQVSLDTFRNTQASVILPPPNDSIALEDAASALYGFVWNDLAGEFFNKSGIRQPDDNKHFRQHEYDWFAEDAWKIRRNLTLNLGLRYQLDGVPYEEGGNLSNLLADPGSFLSGQSVAFTIVGPGTGQQLYKQDYSNFEPRLGFSWDPRGDGKTAVRGAFGIFHDRVFGNLFGNARGNPPFEQDYQTFPFETVNNAFTSGAFPAIVPNTTPSPIVPNGAGLGPILFDTHFRNLVSNNWNFGIQREFGGNNIFDLTYVGSEGHHLYRQRDGNPPDPALVSALVAYCQPTNPNNTFGCTPAQVSGTNLYFGKEFGFLPFDAVANNALYQPYYQQSVGNSIYNSLQLKLTHRLSHGLQVQGSYTWAHAIDDAPDPLAPAQGNRVFPRNSRNLAQERGNSDYDVRHVGVINYIWELPLGRGKGYLHSGVLGRVFEGIQFAGITTLQTGHPFETRCSRDSQRTGMTAWCDLVGAPFAPGANDDPSINAGNKVYFRNPAAFANPAFGGPGNIGRNQFYGPGFVNFDVDFAKKMKLTERMGLEWRMECYNLFNHPHFQQPDNLISDSSFGLITGTVARPDTTTSARQVQVALRLTF